MSISRLLRHAWLIGLLAVWISGKAQTVSPGEAEVAALDSIIHYLRNDTKIEAGRKSHLADSIARLSASRNLPCQEMESRTLQSYALDETGQSDSALQQLLWVNTRFRSDCGPHLRWWLYTGLTNVYLTLGEYRKVDSLVAITQREWDTSPAQQSDYLSILTNGAIAMVYEGNFASASGLFYRLLAAARRVKDDKFIQKTLINLATLKGRSGELDSAYYYLEVAAANVRSTDDIETFLTLQINMAIMDMEQGRNARAQARLDTAESLAIRYNNLPSLASVFDNRAYVFENQGQYGKAYGYLRQFVTLHDSILNLDRIKAVTEMQEKYESEKKARQIQQLQVANLDATLQNERIRNTRNRYLFIGSGVFLVAIGLFGRLQYVRRAKKAIQREKDISEGLLLNILPASVADELKIKGSAEAQHFDQATILFSDFKGFTRVAEHMNAADLVNELNVCFKAFDAIITRHGIEKIKTIGDSYMAAGSIPHNNTATAADVVKAALDMQQFVINRKTERAAQEMEGFDMRVGIHTGPIVAGIVGVKKFQYDIWGDTVNIASRMETASEVGKVNISAVTYQLVKDEPSFVFTPRGMIEAKGKGEMEMYFVENRGK